MACFQIQCILDDETNDTVSNVPYDMVHNASAVVLLLKSANAAMKSNFELAKLAVLHHNSDYTWQMATDHTIQDEMQWMGVAASGPRVHAAPATATRVLVAGPQKETALGWKSAAVGDGPMKW